MSQEITEPLQAAADESIRTWPGVKPKNVFGHLGYVRGGKMFAFLALGGLAVKAPDEDAPSEAYGRDGVLPFMYGGMEMRAWPILPLHDDQDLAEALTFARRVYEALG